MGAQTVILLVEDDAGIRETVADYLASEGYLVVTACDGAEGLERLAERRPALVVLDLHMPVLDGRGFLAALRAGPASRDVPVLLMTGSDGPPAAGVEEVLPKPFPLEQLSSAVRRLARG